MPALGRTSLLLSLAAAAYCVLATAQTAKIVVVQAERSDAVSYLKMITGYHSVDHKAAHLQVRVLEADGSASVAINPVSLFLVVTNNGTSDEVTYVWRLPKGVAQMRGLVVSECGVDISVAVDRITDDSVVEGTDPAWIHVCFLGRDRKLQASATVSVGLAGSAPKNSGAKRPPNKKLQQTMPRGDRLDVR
jgi:hypothetical protein